MNINQQMLLLTVLILIVISIIYYRSYTNERPTCDNYTSTVYLYVILGMLITYFGVLFIAKRKYPITSTKRLLFLVVALGAIFAMFNVDSNKVLLNHFWWIVCWIGMSFLVCSVWKDSQFRGLLLSSLIITIVWVSLLVLFVHLMPDLVQLNWRSGLISVLIITILAWIVPMFFGKSKDNMKVYYKVISACFVIVFSLLVLYDTKLLRVKAESCVGSPDYPKDSMGLFLDITHLLGNINFLRM